MEQGLPVINKSNIDKYRNYIAVAHGKVESIKNNTLHLLVNSETNEDLLINGFKKKVNTGMYIAVIGKVSPDKTLDFIDMIELDEDFDLEFMNEIVPLCSNSNCENFFLNVN